MLRKIKFPNELILSFNQSIFMLELKTVFAWLYEIILCLYSLYLLELVDVNHPVQEGPKQHVGEHLSEESVGEKLLPAAEVLLPVHPGLPQDHRP